ncbi:MAG TPA: tRNA (adenosine(37)-N6)-threonylcarbamoyltransferase complex dimerization subunit type 1 TsaB [Aestuariivirga sp.]|jgi:tRNA threonylcarbamoyl adenosine modification protein YeaZ/ribosomal-protein-alanine acetyltransferase|nr:tRNA (adenosine(37)-N6)-threonylcarbamoyltransferase complex dimerization subunit type 1 TsaB [Aestuariivirga sp.]
MLILALDTSMAACSVCVYDADKSLVIGANQQFMERGQAEALAPMVQDTMKTAGVGFADLSRIAVTTGPGTFTGVRIGLAMARGLGVALSIPITGINSLAAIAANETAKTLPIVVAVDARAGEIYFASYDQSGHELTGPVVVPLAEAHHFMPGHSAMVLGSGAELLLSKLGSHAHVRSDAGDLPISANFVRLAAATPASALPPEPLYLRAPDVKPQATKISFSPAGPASAKLLAEIHGESFATQWNEKAFRELLNSPGTSAILISSQNNPTGFALLRKAADEAEILTICTRPAVRQRGHAKSLVRHVEVLLKNDGVKSLFIEVAISNLAGLALYRSCGFTQAGVRKNYYERSNGTSEDALIMRKGL